MKAQKNKRSYKVSQYRVITDLEFLEYLDVLYMFYGNIRIGCYYGTDVEGYYESNIEDPLNELHVYHSNGTYLGSCYVTNVDEVPGVFMYQLELEVA